MVAAKAVATIPKMGSEATAEVDLTAIMVSRWPPGAGDPDDSLGAKLSHAHGAAAAVWPGVEVTPEQFIEYLAERADTTLPPAAALAALALEDLYLACGCAAQRPTALAAFEGQYLPSIGAQVARIDPSAEFADEVRQTLRIFLLVGGGPDARPPAILQYRGQGPLRRWLGVVAARAALSLKRDQKPWVDLDEAVMVASVHSPELQHLRGVYLDDLRAATREAVTEVLAALSPEDRNLLRWHLVDKVSLRKIAAARNTYVMAVARQYAKIRASIQERIREKARARTGLASAEADSLLSAMASNISITVSGLFEAAAPGNSNR